MHLINWRERQRRMVSSEDEAWNRGGLSAQDPGLRDVYEQLPRSPISVICLPLVKDVNQGGLLRVAEAFRIEMLELSREADGAVDCSAHRGTKRRQPHRWIDAREAIAKARSESRYLVAVTLGERAIDVDQMEWKFPLTLVLGRENDGIDPEIEAQCDASVGIPLFGIVQSLNVAVAAGIVLHSATRAYARLNSEFMPARAASRQLLRPVHEDENGGLRR